MRNTDSQGGVFLKLEGIIGFISFNFLHKATTEFQLGLITLTKYCAVSGLMQLYSWWNKWVAHWYSFFSFIWQGATYNVCLERKGREGFFSFPDVSLRQSMTHKSSSIIFHKEKQYRIYQEKFFH